MLYSQKRYEYADTFCIAEQVTPLMLLNGTSSVLACVRSSGLAVAMLSDVQPDGPHCVPVELVLLPSRLCIRDLKCRSTHS